MSLGSRFAKGGRVATLASLASTPREPLLFLYPHLIRHSSLTASAQASVTDTSPATPQSKPISLPKHAATLNDDPAILDKRFNNPKYVAANKHTFDNATSPPPKERPPNIRTNDGVSSLKKEQSNHMKGTVSNGKTNSRVRKVLSLQEHNENSRESARASRTAYQAYKRQELQTWAPDWRIVLSDLVKHTPQQGRWLSKALEFMVPATDAPKLFQGLDDYFLETGSKYGCVMELGKRDKDTNQYTSFVISGPATAISKCAADILHIAPGVRIGATTNLPFTEPEELSDGMAIFDSGVAVRNVMSESRRKRSSQLPPEKIPRPKIWTQNSFLDHVRTLTSSSVTSHVNRFGFESKEDHQSAVTRILRELFKDPQCKPAITREACHVALVHFVSTNQIGEARILFVRMEMMDLKMVPETFNILLAGAAKANDIHNFHFILHLMIHRGIVPNGKTWARFMMAFSDVRIKLHILTAMQKKGLLNHVQTLRDVCSQLAHPEMESSLDQNQSQAEFVAHMDARYGGSWLSVSSANRILQCLGTHGLISRCWEFLHFMESRAVTPDKYTVNTILQYCKQSTNLTGAVELLRSLPRSMKFVADEETYRFMFELAWRARSYNVARVVWRYACLSAATSFRMRERVFQSLKDSTRVEQPRTARGRWNRFAGPVILGVIDISEHPSRYLEQRFKYLKKERLGRQVASLEDVHPQDRTMSHIDMKHRFTPDAGSSSLDGPPRFVQTNMEHRDLPPFGLPQPVTKDISPSPASLNILPSTITSLATSQQQHLHNLTLPQDPAPWSPCTVGKRVPAYKIAILKELFHADLEIFQAWETVKPFEEMLVAALEKDDEWKRMEGYARKELEWFMDGRALGVVIRTKGSKTVADLDWK